MTEHTHTEANAIADLGVQAAKANRLETHTPAIVLAEGQSVQSLEEFAAHRTRLRGTFSTCDLADFGAYVNRRAAEHPNGMPQAFVDAEKMTCRAVFNIGNGWVPGHADDSALLMVKPTPGYAAVHAINGMRCSQKDLAEWLDDWQDMLIPFYGSPASEEGITPERNSLKRAIRAIRAIEIKAGSQTVTTVGNLHNSASALSSIEARSEHELPTGFQARVEPHAGFGVRIIRLDLSVGTDTPPLLRLRIAGKRELEDAIAQEFVQLIRDGCPDLLPLIGSYSR